MSYNISRNSHRQQVGASPSRRAAFTLTEMLVAVGLLMVIMVIFAQIFSLAVTAMTRQKGLANNNQQARTVFAVLDADLKRMSYRSVTGDGGVKPLAPGLQYNGEGSADEQQGYIYYSENDPDNDTDDVLQFTVDTSVTGAYPGAQRYAGQAPLPLFGRALSLSSSTGVRDQPDWDDGTPGDNVGSSQQAEIVYFLRHGTLYRRVLLLRNNKVGTPPNMARFDQGNQTALAQPGAWQSTTISGTTYEIPRDLMRDFTGNFYTSYDYSAHFGTSPYNAVVSSIIPTPPSSTLASGPLAVFHGSLNHASTNNFPLGVPHFRFGFNNDTSNGTAAIRGRPREFITGPGGSAFIGRFTHEETSHGLFQYPHSTAGNVFARTDYDVDTFRGTGRVPRFVGGSRRGGDILLTSVHSMDIEIWDSTAFGGVGGFVDIGDASAASDFQSNQKRNPGGSGYGVINGTAVIQNNIFDTWHSVPDITSLGVNAIGTGSAQFVPYVNYPSGVTAPTNYSAVYPGRINIQRWSSGMSISDGTRVFPATAPPYGDAIMWEAEIDSMVPQPITYTGSPINEPTWGSTVELVDGSVLDPNEPDIRWRAIDNRRPIKAIRISLRLIDPQSRQLRQVTMVHSFNEDRD
ncbi:PulJ/GspJ family protein [Rubinisphaera margarita]|uniref:PulJ/GspJ family protein n=1 Tax=Rubinisphaera margarita TaxID=2909586 RepID=UPI001EE91C24|nr:hypothetical protein [Rubinisphaera margarita]MCG6154315.1 hypothetical protein [Rubinisphaera margarita]